MARASLEELRLDYEDKLRQHGLPLWTADHPALKRFRASRCRTVDDVRRWVTSELVLSRVAWTDRDEHGRPLTGKPAESVPVRGSPCQSRPRLPPSAVLVANAALSLLNVACYLLDRQLAAQAAAFEHDGGFTERLYRIRSEKRKLR